MTDFLRLDQAPSWPALRAQANAMRALDVRAALVQDPTRVAALSLAAPHVYADLSKHHWTPALDAQLQQLAVETGVLAQRDAMFAGAVVNDTEQRQVMHWLLRQPSAQGLPCELHASLRELQSTLDALLKFAEQVRDDDAITDVVHIGIGGSDLGPQMAVQALRPYALKGKRFHFVSNVDGHELDEVLQGLSASRTLFLIASKTFTTIETMTNARSARSWFVAQQGGEVTRHFVALTTNVAEAAAFGIDTCFGFWDWVGGRYSLWSAIGLPLAIAIGAEGFRAFLAGGHAMDQHFLRAAPGANLPLRLGLLDVWYRNGLGYTSRCIAPYHSGLRRFPAYLQQLEMESNGKRVDRAGRALPYGTSPVLWGEPGTNGQHAFFQMLHQGTDIVPVEFIAVREPQHGLAEHHEQLLANAFAQAQALLQGKADAGGHRDFPGNRPSTFLLLERLDPASLGALIALHEHRVFVSGAVWGINSFDQWGVELGKVLAKDLRQRLTSGHLDTLDPSTAALLQRVRS
jgi:glucose-6-phosphate isomerase